MTQRKKSIIIIALVIGGSMIIGLAALLTSFSQPKISSATRQKLQFKPYAPVGREISNVKYDSDQAVLSFTMGQMNERLVVAEEAYPETLIYDKLISSMNAERQVGTALGQTTITHPKAAPGKEVAVIQAGTTLIFVTSHQPLTDDQWRDLLNAFKES